MRITLDRDQSISVATDSCVSPASWRALRSSPRMRRRGTRGLELSVTAILCRSSLPHQRAVGYLAYCHVQDGTIPLAGRQGAYGIPMRPVARITEMSLLLGLIPHDPGETANQTVRKLLPSRLPSC